MPHFGEVAPESPGYRRFCRIRTGRYTGDGSLGQAITGIGFRPKYVAIWVYVVVETPTLHWFMKIDEHFGDICHRSLGETETSDAIISLDADGFTVDDNGADADPNKLGQVYIFMALG